jgi:hypothetical protein
MLSLQHGYLQPSRLQRTNIDGPVMFVMTETVLYQNIKTATESSEWLTNDVWQQIFLNPQLPSSGTPPPG